MKLASLVFAILFSMGSQAKAKNLAITLDCGAQGIKTINARYPVEYVGDKTYWYSGYDDGQFIAYVYPHKVKNFEYASPEAHFYCSKL